MNMAELNDLQAWEHIWRMDLRWIDAQQPSNGYVRRKYDEKRSRSAEYLRNNLLEQQLVCASSPAPLW